MTDQDEASKKSGIIHPTRVLSRKSLLPILYLAERMASSDNETVRRETRVIEQIAKAANFERYKDDPDYRRMTEDSAIAGVGSETSKMAAMVILTLVLKADTQRKDEERGYFQKVRERLGAGPITVPVDFDAHMKLALEYVQT